jgi:hypothetical protein
MGRSRGLSLNSPTFPRRPIENSDASSVDIKRSDLEPGFSATEIGEEEAEQINDDVLYEEPSENDIINEPATPKPEIQKYEIPRYDMTSTPDPYSLQEASVIREQV